MSGPRSSRGPGRGTSRRQSDAGRSTARPEQRRRTATSSRRTVPDTDASGTDLSKPVLRRRFTSRAAVLLAVICLLVVGLAYPLREYVAQRAQIQELEREQRQQQEDIAALQREKQRWQDPAYVEQQARERLHYARPGELTYVVIDDGGSGGGGQDGGRSGPSWSQRLWSSVRVADDPGK